MSKESIIKAFEGVNIRIVWDDELEQYFFAVNDIVQVLTESKDPRDYIKKMLKLVPELNFKWGTICPPLECVLLTGNFTGLVPPRCRAFCVMTTNFQLFS